MIVQYLVLALVVTVHQIQGQTPAECRSIAQPQWGEISCTDDTSIGSMCKLSCQEFYDLDGTTDDAWYVTCQDGGTWNGSVDFSCSPIRCFPDLRTPTNGDLICSATNLVQSLCVFFCKDHYDLAGVDIDRNAYAICKDDGDGDELGVWSRDNSGAVFPPTLTPTCEPIQCDDSMQAPDNGQVICSADNFSGSTCVFYCMAGYRFKGSNEPVQFSNCKDDGDYDNVGKWTLKAPPKCEKCKRVKDVQIVSLIHEYENDPRQFQLAAKMVVKVITVLKRKYKMALTVTVNRYSDGVDAANEVFTTDFQLKKDRQKIEAIPYSGQGADIEQALRHVGSKLNGDGSILVAFIITNDMREYNEEAQELAEELRARGITIFVFTIPHKNRAVTWQPEDLAKLAGSTDMVFHVSNQNSAEEHKSTVAERINEEAMEKGCMEYPTRG